MDKHLLGIVVGWSMLLVLACGSDSKTSEQNSDSLKAGIQKEDAVLTSQSTTWDDSLKKYFTLIQIPKIKQAVEEFNRIKTASDLASFYQKTLESVTTIIDEQIEKNDPTEYSGDDSPDVHWRWFSDYFPPVKCAVLCSECTYGALVNLVPLAEKARQTPEKEDDLFFDLAMTAYNPQNEALEIVYDGRGRNEVNVGEWSIMINCDICMASMLGSGYHYKILQKLEKVAPARSLFGDVMDQYLETTLLIDDSHYNHDKATVLAELDKMLTSPVLTDKQKKALQESRENINTDTSIEFDCAQGDCTWDDL
jgi:hypothetical protein